MNWEVIGTVAEIAAAIGVVVSLIYLARQIRQASLDSEVSANQEVSRDYASLLSSVMNDENADAFIKGLNSYDALTPVEKYKFDFCMAGYLNIVEVIMIHNAAGRGLDLLEMVTDIFFLFVRPVTHKALRNKVIWFFPVRGMMPLEGAVQVILEASPVPPSSSSTINVEPSVSINRNLLSLNDPKLVSNSYSAPDTALKAYLSMSVPDSKLPDVVDGTPTVVDPPPPPPPK